MRTRIGGLALLVVSLLAACGEPSGRIPVEPATPDAQTTPTSQASASAEGWTALPDSPLSAREGALGFWVDGRMLVIGGTDGPPCPPNASCVVPPNPLRDGAAYEPATGQWIRIADAPVSLAQARGVAAGQRVYLLVQGNGLLEYDAAADHWRQLPLDTVSRPASRSLAADGPAVVAYIGSHEDQEGPLPADVRLDPATGEWAELPPSPLGPGFDRLMLGTDHGLVLLQAPLVDNPGAGDRPSFWEAAVLQPDGTWRELPTSQILTGYHPWVWSGGRVVAAVTGDADGGGEPPGDYGRGYPFGGMLDVAAGTWEALPDAGPLAWPGVTLSAHDDETVFRDGGLLDVRARRWTAVPPPPGGIRQGATAVWGDGTLLLWGGASFADPARGRLHADGWSWTPPAG